MVAVKRQADLLEVVDTLRPCSRLANLLHRWHQKRNQNCNDGNHHEQFNQGEPRAFSRRLRTVHDGPPKNLTRLIVISPAPVFYTEKSKLVGKLGRNAFAKI